jgi:hypothetical protein
VEAGAEVEAEAGAAAEAATEAAEAVAEAATEADAGAEAEEAEAVRVRAVRAHVTRLLAELHEAEMQYIEGKGFAAFEREIGYFLPGYTV